MDEGAEVAQRGEVFQDLPRGGVDVEGDVRVDAMVLEHHRHDGEIAQARVGRGADHALVHRPAGHLADRDHVAGAAGAGDQRHQRGEVDLDLLVIVGGGVGEQFAPVRFAAAGGEKRPQHVIGGEHAGRRPEFRTHVGDDVAIHGAQAFKPVAVVLEDLAHPSADIVATQHFQDDVLGADPVGQAPGQADADDARHPDVEGLAGDRQRHFQAAGADGEHAHRAGRAGVAVGAEQGAARLAEVLHVHRVAHPVARPAEPDAETPAGALQEQVVVGVLEVGLQQVVVDVLHRDLGPGALEAHRLEFEHHHGAGGVLGEGLVDFQGDRFTLAHRSFEQVRGDQFLGDVLRHGTSPGGDKDALPTVYKTPAPYPGK
ncbi:hypothetical protein D3C78_866080 [compost metagenome]